METKLDPDQKKAVEHFEGPALVVAGPGSGKTTVIKERILHLIREHNVDPEQILAIAFTNAAADEMKNRLRKETLLKQTEPKICTLHTFGKDLITDHYDLLGFNKEPDIWDADDIIQTINDEKNRLNRANDEKPVIIYKFEGTITGRCYIGQTTDPERREVEHRTHSSNRRLRDALQKGNEEFEFKEIKTVSGQKADEEEAEQINLHRNQAVVNLNQGTEQIERENSEIPVTIYKIKSSTTVTCRFGLTTDIESIDRPEGFEIINEEVPLAEGRRRIVREIARHKNWAVFNRQDPLHARESNKRRIEIFCDHFNVSYDDVLKHTPKFRDLMKKFDNLKDDIENAKRQVTTGLFEPDKIGDPVFRAFTKRYEERKEESDAIDFLDMLIYSANMLEENQYLLHEYRNTYRYTFVDEFQDISPVDFRLIDLFSENLFAVGDDDQAIYSFRGGNSEIMQKNFGNRKNVEKYEITRNYRSTSTIVRHAKTLIEHNSVRIPKDLRAHNSEQSQVEILGTPKETIKRVLLRELSNLLTTDFQNVGILARNWRGEINKIQEILKSSELDTQGFKIDWKKLDDPGGDSDDLYDKHKKIMLLHRGTQEIEILNIHTAKGREWDKVILLVNTMYNSLPDRRNDPTEERRLFYVAVTRAKQELTVLNGGNCQFISEFQNAPFTKEVLEDAFKVELAIHEPKFKMELEEDLKIALGILESKRKKKLEEASKAERRKYELELNRLRHLTTETKNEIKKMELALSQQLKPTNDALLKDLIPVLDEFKVCAQNLSERGKSYEYIGIPLTQEIAAKILFEWTETAELHISDWIENVKNYHISRGGLPTKGHLEQTIRAALFSLRQFGRAKASDQYWTIHTTQKSPAPLSEPTESNNIPTDLGKASKSFQLAYKQLLDLLKYHQMKPTEAFTEISNIAHHEESLQAIYPGERQTDKIAREKRHHDPSHDQVIHKAEVVISKEQNIWTTDRLTRVVEIYLERIISRDGNRLNLINNINKLFIKQKMVQYLSNLDNESVEEIGSYSTKSIRSIDHGRHADYCVCPEKTHLCTDIFRDFWNYMWKVVEQSRNIPES